MNYWIAKANPGQNRPFAELFRPGKSERWGSRRTPRTFAKGDRIVFWQSGTGLRVIALGEVISPSVKNEEDDRKNYILRNLTAPLAWGPDIKMLRKTPLFRGAVFLKAAAAGTIFSLTPEQGRWIYAALAEKNIDLPNLWPDVAGTSRIPDIEEAVLEGRLIFSPHFRRERDPNVIRRKRAQFLAQHGKLYCEACGSDFLSVYGESSAGVYEVHHKLPLGKAGAAGRKTPLKDLAILCSNCHRVIHRHDPMISVEQLSAKIRRNRLLISPKMA